MKSLEGGASMRRSRLFSALACGVALALVAAADEEVKSVFIDIQPKGNHNLADDLGNFDGNHLGNVPQGEQTFEGAKFKVGEKLVQLKGQDDNEELPEKVEGIKVGAKGDTLHILQSTEQGEVEGSLVEDGAKIGEYVVHYADK